MILATIAILEIVRAVAILMMRVQLPDMVELVRTAVLFQHHPQPPLRRLVVAMGIPMQVKNVTMALIIVIFQMPADQIVAGQCVATML